MPRRRSWVILYPFVALAAACQCGPSISSPLVLGYEAGAARIEGRGFGSPRSGSTVTVSGHTIASDDAAAVVSWSDAQIDLVLPPEVRSGEISVKTPSGA